MFPIPLIKCADVTYRTVEVEYLEWVGKTIEALKVQNAELVAALEAVRIEYAELFHADLVKQIDQALGKEE